MSRMFVLASFLGFLLLATATQAQSLVQELSSLDRECSQDCSSFTVVKLELAALAAATMVGGSGQEDWKDLRKQIDQLTANAASRQARLERLGKLHKWSKKERGDRLLKPSEWGGKKPEKQPPTFQGWWQALDERNRQLDQTIRSAKTLFK